MLLSITFRGIFPPQNMKWTECEAIAELCAFLDLVLGLNSFSLPKEVIHWWKKKNAPSVLASHYIVTVFQKKKSRTTKIRLKVKFVAEIRHYKICLTIPRHLVSGFRLCRNKVPNVLARYWFFPEANSSKWEQMLKFLNIIYFHSKVA